MLRRCFFHTAAFAAINNCVFLLNARFLFLGPRPFLLTTALFFSCCDHCCDMLRPYLSVQKPYKTRTNPYRTRTKPYNTALSRIVAHRAVFKLCLVYHNGVGGCSCHDDDFRSNAGNLFFCTATVVLSRGYKKGLLNRDQKAAVF